jgi:hypothetical protein
VTLDLLTLEEAAKRFPGGGLTAKGLRLVENSLRARSPRLGGPCHADTLLEIANQ